MTCLLLKTVRGWASSEVPAVRRQAVQRLEQAMSSLDSREALETLGLFETARDPATGALARQLRRRIKGHALSELVLGSAGGPLGLSSTWEQWKPLGKLPLPPTEIRALAVGLLQPLARRLAKLLEPMSPGSQATESVWSVLAALGHSGLGAEARRLWRDGTLTPQVLQALVHGGDPEAGKLTCEVLRSLHWPLHAHAIANLPHLQGVDPWPLARQAARSPHGSVRAALARALGGMPGEDSMTLLLELACDPSPLVALAALRALGRRQDRRLPELLLDLARREGETELRAEAIRLLALQHEVPLSTSWLEAVPHSAVGLPVAVAAVETLPLLGGDAGRIRQCLELLLGHRAPRLKLAAVTASLAWRAPEALAELREMLRSPDARTRRWAGVAVGYAAEPSLVAEAVAALRVERHPLALAGLMEGVRAAAPGSPPEMLQPLLEAGPEPLRLWFVELAAKISDSNWQGLLSRSLAEEPAGPVRDRLLLAVARRHGLRELRQCLTSGQPELAADALEHLETFSALEVVSLVQPLLEAPTPAVRARAALALWKLGYLDGLPSVERMVSDLGKTDCFLAGLEAAAGMARTLDISVVDRYPELLRSICRTAEVRKRQDAGEDSSAFIVLPQLSRTVTPAAEPVAPAAPATPLARVTPAAGPATPARPEALVAPAPPPAKPAAQEAPAPPFAAEVRLEELLRLGRSDPQGASAAIGAMSPELLRTAEGGWLHLREKLAADPEEAAAAAEEFLARPAGPMVAPWLELGMFKASSWDQAGTIGAYVKAFQSQLGVLNELVESVSDHLKRQEYPQAQATLELLTRLMPLDQGVHRAAGETFLGTRMLEAAARQLFLAHVLEPDNQKLTIELAVCCIQTDRRELARALAESVLTGVPASSQWAKKARKVLDSLQRQR